MKYLIKNKDGSVSIMTLVDKDTTVDKELEKTGRTTSVESYRPIEESDLPVNREFRDAWVDVTESAKVDVDVEKAKAIQLERLRYERNKKLKELDVETIIAIDSGDESKLAAVRAKKQALRDATEALKAFNKKGVATEADLEVIKVKGTLTS